MSKQEELIGKCRYYSGQANNPFDDQKLSWFWDMERVYVMHNGKFEGESEYYKAIGGKTYSGIPFDLLMVMFTSWAKHSSNIKNEINDFYIFVDDYLFIANDHFSEDKIPNSK